VPLDNVTAAVFVPGIRVTQVSAWDDIADPPSVAGAPRGRAEGSSKQRQAPGAPCARTQRK